MGMGGNPPPARFLTIIFLLAVTNIMGIQFARYLNIGGRREFSLLRQTRQITRRYRQVVENATQAIFVIQHHRMPLANPMTQEITGYSAEELAEIAFADLVSPDDRERLLQRFSAVLDGDKPRGVITFRIRDKHGRLKWIEAAGVIIDWEGAPALLAFANNVTQRKQAEEEKEESAKMQGVLEMAGAACHEINQPLQVISAILELMSLQEPQAPKTIEHIKTMSIQLKRLIHITRSIQGITRYRTRDYLGETKIVDIHKSSADSQAQNE
jgi:PAS domain S-box-containing protein